jgi:hypothetical protein
MLGRKRAVKIDPPVIERRYRSVAFLSRFLPRIAETYGINLIADAYRHPSFPLPRLPAGEQRPLYELLDEFVLPAARWSKDGDFLLIRQRNWYQARVAEIPERLVRSWATRLRQERRLTLQDAVSLALALNDEQWRTFIPALHDEGVLVGGSFYSSYGEIWVQFLRAYGSLTPAQRQMILAGKSVPYAAMPVPARRWLQVALDRREHPLEGRDAGLLSLELQQVERVVSPSERGFTIVYRTAAPRDAEGDAGFTPRTLWTETHARETGTPPLGTERVERALFHFSYGEGPTRVQVEFRPPWVHLEPGAGRDERSAAQPLKPD